jgi:hypothetical protein
LHAQLSVAYRVAQISGEIRDVSAIFSNALQQFLSLCVFFATFWMRGGLNAELYFLLNTPASFWLFFFY